LGTFSIPSETGRKILSERPFAATLSSSIWHVAGTLCCRISKGKVTGGAWVGGVAMVDIRQSDGRILKTGHTK